VTRRRDAADVLRGDVVLVSPHHDDAALSLGAAIACAARSGSSITVVTVFSGNPDSTAVAAPWDAACGFATAGEAARARRGEDARACEILGATYEWLPFSNEEYGDRRDGTEIWSALAPHLAAADAVLVPGYPLHHNDHAYIARRVLERLPAAVPRLLYVEQPYANLAAIGRGYRPAGMLAAARIALRTRRGRRLVQPVLPAELASVVGTDVSWAPVTAGRRDRRAKAAAIEAYESQLPPLGRRLVDRIRLYEWGFGGEGIGLLPSAR
jgi:LmbE family N-acetylglucosaminyl deacetylase